MLAIDLIDLPNLCHVWKYNTRDTSDCESVLYDSICHNTWKPFVA